MFDTGFFDRLDKDKEKMDAEYARLEPCLIVPKVGDRVLVACGFLGMGFLYVREEAVVEECASTSYYVRFVNYESCRAERGEYRMWIHQSLITDVLSREAAELGGGDK